MPLIGVPGLVNDLHLSNNNILVFDTRTPDEYRVSHIPGAKYCGFSDFDLTAAKQIIEINSPEKIIFYCSIGYRSEIIADKVKQELPQLNILNLKGGIFAYANAGHRLEGKQPGKVHPYSDEWSVWLNQYLI